MPKKQKLELTWIGKDVRPKLEPRILLENQKLSFHAEARVSENDIFDNILIHGDNLLALKALEQEYTGKVKCIYIDPPYNTGNAFEHYDDGVEHSIWLGLMRDRIVILKKLLSQSGSIWINLDDIEVHYCKVMCDEIFGRKNFVTNLIWEKSDSPRMDAGLFSSRHDHILVYANDINQFTLNRISSDDDIPVHYDKTTTDGRRYYLKPLRAMGKEDARTDRPSMFFEMSAPDGTKVLPYRQDGSEGRWRWGEGRVVADAHLIEWVKGRKGWTPYYRIFAENTEGRPPETIWYFNEVGSNRTSKAEIKALFRDSSPFGTPKPEALIQKVLAVTTSPRPC